jgi:hypothetical protein
MHNIKIILHFSLQSIGWLLQFKCLLVSGTWSDGSGSGISDVVWSAANILVYVADTMFGLNGRNEYVGLAVHIKLEMWNRVLCSVKRQVQWWRWQKWRDTRPSPFGIFLVDVCLPVAMLLMLEWEVGVDEDFSLQGVTVCHWASSWQQFEGL